MSNSLLKKSLQLFDDDVQHEPINNKKDKSVEYNSSTLSTNRKGRKKEMRKLKRKQQQEKLEKSKKNKTAEDEYYKYSEWDNTDDNLFMIAKMAQLDSASPDIVTKVLDYNKGKLSKNKTKEEEPSQNQSVFSDRDFDQFEKDYNVDFWDK